jgi:hypothetical protein
MSDRVVWVGVKTGVVTTTQSSWVVAVGADCWGLRLDALLMDCHEHQDDIEGQDEEHACIAEHKASGGERRVTAVWRGTTGAGEMTEHDADDAASNACDKEPYANVTRVIVPDTKETRGSGPEAEQAEGAADEAGDGRGQPPARRGGCSPRTTRRGRG